MSDDKISVDVEVVDKFTNGLGSATQSFQKFGDGLSGLGEKLKEFAAVAGIAFSTEKVIEFAKECLHSFGEAERSAKLLQSSIENLGVSFRDVGQGVNEAVRSISELTRFTKGDAREAISGLVDITRDLDGALKALPTIADFATARQMSLGEAANFVAKAAEGVTTGLRRAGIVMNETTKAAFEAADETTRLAYTMDLLGARFAGRAAADLDTYSGRVAQFHKEIHELKVDIGAGLVDLLVSVADGFRDVAVWGNQALGFLGAGKDFSTSEQLENRLSDQRIQRMRQDSGHAASPEAQRALAAMSSDLQLGSMLANKAAIDAQKAAMDEAERVAKVYAATIGGLTGVVSDAGTKEEALRAALEKSAAGFSINEKAARALAESLRDYSAIAALPTNTLQGFLGPLSSIDQQVSSQLDTFIAKFDSSKFIAAMEDAQVQIDNFAAEDLAKKLKAQAAEVGRSYVENFQHPLTSIFADLAETGGKNFGQISGEAFNKAIQEGSKGLADLFGGLFGGSQKPIFDQASGQWMVGGRGFGGGQEGENAAQQFANQQGGGDPNSAINQIAALIKAGQVGAASYSQRGTSDLSAAAGGVVAGVGVLATSAAASGGLGAVLAGEASIGPVGWIAAIVTAVAAVVGKLLQPSAGADYKYGLPTVEGGVGSFRPQQNIDAAETKQIIANIQAQTDAFVGGYQKLLLTLDQPLLKMADMTFNPKVGRFEAGADLGNAASQLFSQELKQWIEGTLPRDIAAKFFKPLASAFEQFGFTEGSFQTLWMSLQNLDPKKALELLNSLAEGGMNITKALDFFRKDTGLGGSSYGTATLNSTQIGTALNEASKTFPEQLKDSSADLIRLANSMKDLPLADQIAAYQQLGQGLDAMRTKTIQFLQQIKASIDAFQRSIDEQKFGYQLQDLTKKDGSPDVQAQINFLKQRADSIFNQIGTTTDPAKVSQLGGDLQKLIDQIVQLGGQLGPEQAAALRHWAETSLDNVNKAVVARLEALGNEVGNVTQSIADQLQPALDLFTHGIETTVTTVGNFGDGLDGGRRRLELFSNELDGATQRLRNLGGDSHTNTTQSRRLLALG